MSTLMIKAIWREVRQASILSCDFTEKRPCEIAKTEETAGKRQMKNALILTNHNPSLRRSTDFTRLEVSVMGVGDRLQQH